MRLIDPDAAFDEIDERLLPEDATEYARGVLDAMQYIVNDAPEIDAQPVRHAYWMKSSDPDASDHEVWYQCSHCHKTADRMSLYCPNCGAGMDQPAETVEVNL